MRALYPDASAFADRTGRGPATPGQLREVLREARARGFAVEDGEVTLGLRSVGVAVRDHAGWPAAAIAVTWPNDSDTDAGLVAALATDAADELSHRIGGR